MRHAVHPAKQEKTRAQTEDQTREAPDTVEATNLYAKDAKHLVEDKRDDAQQHSLLTWTGLGPGDVVSLRDATTRQYVVGAVEIKTRDGLIIWIRDDLNDRRALHFNDCESVKVVKKSSSGTSLPHGAATPQAGRHPTPS